MVYLLKMGIFHGYVSHNQMVNIRSQILDVDAGCLVLVKNVVFDPNMSTCRKLVQDVVEQTGSLRQNCNE